MNQHDQVLVIGATGKTGSRVVQRLNAMNVPVRGVSRSTSPAFDWFEPTTWPAALAGCERAYVSFQPDLAIPAAEGIMSAFVEAAKAAGIKHLVLMSGRGEDGAQRAEAVVKNSGLTWNVVRASWFHQNFSEGILRDAIVDGQVMLPVGDIDEPFVDTDDIADVAVAALTQAHLHNTLFEVTGPALLTFADCVRIIAEMANIPVAFQEVPLDDFLAGMQQDGVPDDVLWLMKTLFTEVLDGRNSYLCDGVQAALGREPTSFADYVAKTLKTNAWGDAQSAA